MSLIDSALCCIAAFILGGCVSGLIMGFVWERECRRINDSWGKHCKKMITECEYHCKEINLEWKNFYDDLIESLAKAEEGSGSDENDIT